MKKINNLVPDMEDPSPLEFMKQIPLFRILSDEDIENILKES